MTASSPTLSISQSLLICSACGAQYEIDESSSKSECRICDDPRQFVPATGQTFTTLAKLKAEGHKNMIQQCAFDKNVYEIWTEPKVGIGQRACLVRTPHGNMLWDLVAYLDEETVDRLASLGGLKFIVISHPHFYTTWADWSATFKCPVYMSQVDSVWANRASSPSANLRLLTQPHTELLPGVIAAICGGHFDGSMVLYSSHHKSLFAADTILPVPSAHNPDPAKPGVVSYSFMWSIPNSIPLSPDKIMGIWKGLKPFDFEATYGVFAGGSNLKQNPRQRMSLKARLLESAKIAVRNMGYTQHEIFDESL